MGYVLVDDIWVPKSDDGSVGTHSFPKSKSFSFSVPSSYLLNVTISQTGIELKLDSIKDILLGSHFYLDKIKDVSKETTIDVALIKVRLDQVIKKSAKIVVKIQTTTDSLSIIITTQFSNLKDFTSQTVAYFYHFENRAPAVGSCLFIFETQCYFDLHLGISPLMFSFIFYYS